jgi:hypothetical protein
VLVFKGVSGMARRGMKKAARFPEPLDIVTRRIELLRGVYAHGRKSARRQSLSNGAPLGR